MQEAGRVDTAWCGHGFSIESTREVSKDQAVTASHVYATPIIGPDTRHHGGRDSPHDCTGR